MGNRGIRESGNRGIRESYYKHMKFIVHIIPKRFHLIALSFPSKFSNYLYFVSLLTIIDPFDPGHEKKIGAGCSKA